MYINMHCMIFDTNWLSKRFLDDSHQFKWTQKISLSRPKEMASLSPIGLSHKKSREMDPLGPKIV